MGRSHILLNLLYFRIRHLASGFSINTVNTDFRKVEQVEQMFVTGRLIVKILREMDISHYRFFLELNLLYSHNFDYMQTHISQFNAVRKRNDMQLWCCQANRLHQTFALDVYCFYVFLRNVKILGLHPVNSSYAHD